MSQMCQTRKSPSFDQAPSTREVGGIAGVSAHASRARTSRVHSGALLNMPTLPRVGTAFLTRGINFFRPPTPYGIWDRSVKRRDSIDREPDISVRQSQHSIFWP